MLRSTARSTTSVRRVVTLSDELEVAGWIKTDAQGNERTALKKLSFAFVDHEDVDVEPLVGVSAVIDRIEAIFKDVMENEDVEDVSSAVIDSMVLDRLEVELGDLVENDGGGSSE